jgi:hypothetical protein
MKDKFLSYYWPWLKGFAYLFLFLSFIEFVYSEGFAIDIQRIIRLLFILVLSSFVLGGVFHIFYDLYRPWRKKRIFQRSLIRKVEIEGFKQDIENDCLEGYFNGYYITLSPNTDLEKGDSISINVFLDLRKSEVNDVLEKIQEYDLIQSDGFYWFTASVLLTLTGNITTDKLLEKIEDMTVKLNKYKVHPFLPEN